MLVLLERILAVLSELRRIFVGTHDRAGTVEDLFKSIGEAGIALIEDRGVPRCDLEAAVSDALADLLQVHPLSMAQLIPVCRAL